VSSVVALFLFALIVGQIRNIIGSLSTKQDAYLIIVDITVRFVKRLNLPKNILNKVTLWFEFYSKEQNASKYNLLNYIF
jgi:hypothetical protein